MVRRVPELPSLRVVRRRRGAAGAVVARPSLTAAVQAVTDDPSAALKKSISGGFGRKSWQDEAWHFYRTCGEFSYYVIWRAASCSRARLVASGIDPVTGQPTLSVEDDDRDGQRFAEIVRGIAGGPQGQASMIRRVVEVLSVAGEVWVAILVTDEGEMWQPVTAKEITTKPGGGVTIKLPAGDHDFNAANGDGLIRIWQPDPEEASKPFAPVVACLGSLREIEATTATIATASRSRLIGNGILFIPQECSLPQSAPSATSGPEELTAVTVEQKLQDLIVKVATAAETDPSSLASVVPLVAAAPGEWINRITHLKIDNSITETAIATRADAMRRLAIGLDVSPERITGMGGANHWSMWGITDQDVQMHINPAMSLVVSAIYDGVLRPVLAKEGIDAKRYTLSFDTSGLTADPDKTDEAKSAFAAGAITGEALVRLLGLAEGDCYDFATLEGWQVWAQDRVSEDPTRLPLLAPLLAPLSGLEFPAAPALPAAAPVPADDEGSGAQQEREPGTEDDSTAAGLVASAGLAGVEALAVEMSVARALEIAGKRRVNTGDREQRERLRGIAPHEYHRVMGPVADADVARLIKGWDSSLNDHSLIDAGLSPGVVRARVEVLVRRALTAAVIDGQVL